ncbi:P-loop containing nucleoside triphosphate hydrolase protein [Westerdykella ornata]|uniref:P-loop containing nucleoside triphosphate hydrolase protein n=1 Tax=Westerdykella ornata TaxID=318751 RepID=A0A6A6JP37_WESOR|nr:P-loop containing nucleoside triphosphate hydrolase protein [Westerdykella ornata]KAF2277903.1 P-loop containing nucleoside triphosphate hydrolase protein [Westerdykella ornata]
MADQDEGGKRLVRLTKLFNGVINGHRELKSIADGARFLEALYAQESATNCVERIVAAQGGISAVAKAFRLSRESDFLNGPATSTLRYLADPSLKQLYGGTFLHRIIEAIVEPPTFWNTLCESHFAGSLSQAATHAFAWLLLEILSAPAVEGFPDVRSVAEQVTSNESLINASILETRNLGHKIKHLLERTSKNSSEGPGGRHDNDFADFRKIKILPTPDEFASVERPFYRRADAIKEVEPEERGLLHLDNQFRLLREDLLGELRNDFQIAVGQKRGRRKLVLDGLRFVGLDCGTETRRKFCSLQLLCGNDIPQIARHSDPAARKKVLAENKNLIKHQAFGCLISEGAVLAFANVERDEDMLSQKPPIIVLRIQDSHSLSKVLQTTKTSAELRFVQVDTAVFAYEPILRCLQRMTELPMKEQLLDLESRSSEAPSPVVPPRVITWIRDRWRTGLQSTLSTPKAIQLDAAQAESLITGLSKRLSLIQGPPGTGKSFIGALIAKTLVSYTTENILVLTYTNHALDQFLEDLLDIGIPPDRIVRLGPRYTTRTKPLSISEQQNTYRMKPNTYNMIQDVRSQAESYHEALMKKTQAFKRFRATDANILDYLELSEDSEYFDAFTVPEAGDGMIQVQRRGKKMDKLYLIKRWIAGQQAGVFEASARRDFPAIWSLPKDARSRLVERWVMELIQEHVSEISNLAQKYDQCQTRLEQLFNEKTASIISQKRIIGCTTTAAAKYAEMLQKAAPGIVLVEEAGEVLESHLLTALTPNTKQLVLIGDHKQLRPKVSNFQLTIEKGDGYDLNMSLFERLITAGVPHTTLMQQHRMRPEISSLVRNLTYPELEDAPKTLNRPHLRGLQDNVIFLSHDHPELNAERIADRRDQGANISKENQYEVDMALKCVRYLGQQGYGTDKIVILTPYLGQLFLLMKTLSNENDPVLNDLDSFELIRAGLMSPAAADVGKQKIRISTIDNYQGEESDIVIASLTRSNDAGEIGFMASPQRVNVLLSRAKNALIMIGNANTFMTSRKGKEVWIPLMEQLKREGHVYDGLPVKCERHPDRKALLTSKEQFDVVCPDGGCSEPCGVMLSCGQHVCPHRCHQLQDHSKMKCEAIVTTKCPQDHHIKRRCHDLAAGLCRRCEADARETERKRQRDFLLDQERQAKQAQYAKRLAEIQDEIAHEKRVLKDRREHQERLNSLAQQEKDLEELKKRSRAEMNSSTSQQRQPVSSSLEGPNGNSDKNPAATSQSSSVDGTTLGLDVPTPASPGSSLPSKWDHSESKDEWEAQKKLEGAENEALDKLMDMIGLESVKQQFLDIKAKVDMLVRQGVSLQNERLGAALLGNPGTGKTTVARLYAKFLSKVGALPGDFFFETSGASLANEGVTACKDHIQKILEEGGGVFFIDEAYQLVSGNSYGGAAVLDYLLAEIENLTGKIVFVLAGYQKQMEAFFAHNPGIPSRIPIEMKFEDYNDGELQRILCHYINARYKGQMKVEDGFGGLFIRIVARRIGRGRGREGFGNASEVQNVLARITERQAKRLRKERRAGLQPVDNLLTRQDLIGPEPASVLRDNAAWNELQKLIGLKAVKESVQVLLDSIQYNYQRELEEKPLVQYSLNKCFIGSPGTGKTSVAKLYGRILADIGLLSNGEVIVKNPADFVGSVLGQSETNTKGILASTVGKVLIIDEAYMLAGTSVADPYKTAVIDTIVAEVQSTPGEDRCVLLLGYKEQMEEMFRDVNPGLARRFPLDSAFVFEDFDDDELRKILDLKLRNIGFNATDQAKNVAMEVLKHARNRPNFGNAGEVDIILDRAKGLHQKHLSLGKVKAPDTFEAIDFDPEHDRGERAATNLPQLFHDVVGCEELIKQLQGYQTTAANMKALGMDPREQIPFNFLFKGPPGTGKTTTAQKMGKVFYDMGLLAQAKVVNCSATDLIGQYVGQTGPKVQKLLETALGKVLFIDEAYRLAEGGFATEAMDELVDCLTKPKYAQKLVTILAGYDEAMDRLMSVNPGLSSRFPESVIFKHMEPETCLELLVKLLDGLKKKQKAAFNISIVTPPSADQKERILELFQQLSQSASWGNARDVKSLAKAMFGTLISTPIQPGAELILTEAIIINAMEAMLDERTRRNEAVGTTRHTPHSGLLQISQQQQQQKAQPASSSKISVEISAPSAPTQDSMEKPREAGVSLATNTEKQNVQGPNDRDPKRDAGVSDAVWHQLSLDKQAAIAREKEFQRLQAERLREEQRLGDLERAEKAAAEEKERRRLEQERIRLELERREREELLAAMEREREKERKAKEMLKALGRCPVGFEWIKQSSGYRCAGGSHFMSDKQLGL